MRSKLSAPAWRAAEAKVSSCRATPGNGRSQTRISFLCEMRIARGTRLRGYDRKLYYIFLNTGINVKLTVNVSGRFFNFTMPRPVSSRVIDEIAFMLTMVAR